MTQVGERGTGDSLAALTAPRPVPSPAAEAGGEQRLARGFEMSKIWRVCAGMYRSGNYQIEKDEGTKTWGVYPRKSRKAEISFPLLGQAKRWVGAQETLIELDYVPRGVAQ